MDSDLPIVLVTGVSGFVGSHVCLSFLKDGGFKVRGTVRNPNDEKKVAPLKKSFGEYFDKLELVAADLNDAESFKKAMVGVTYVAHVASPVPDPKAKQDEKTLVTPAVNGCKYVAEAAVENGVKRIVFTSSIAAVLMQPHPVDLYTPDHWTTRDCRGITPYDISKMESEKHLWNYRDTLPEDKKYDLVTLCPAIVVGPQLQSADNVAGTGVKQFLEGKAMISEHQTGIIDVRDLAQAHVNAIKIEEAKNKRYLMTVSPGIQLAEWARILYDHYGPNGNKEFPKAKNPKDVIGKWILSCAGMCDAKASYALELWGMQMNFDNKDVKNLLQIEFSPIDKAIIDCAESLKEWGKITPAGAKK